MQSQNISLPSKAGSVVEIQNALRPFDMVQAKVTKEGYRFGKIQKFGTLHDFACHPCAGAMLIFSVSF